MSRCGTVLSSQCGAPTSAKAMRDRPLGSRNPDLRGS
jgi:hypothetical protein